ncbi:glycylpeptide N-tetradecanoyltransferase 1-like isoform X2 [Corythoichthys intestinalis]|uniref:glycylpeptide N-tetradecanoyltransferase 1-like isoform X2 n=1 Tax=Corythoichthys intestinalis TaxID=161448 RepID=UPI0025A4E688|nr:glycylpeptide N-tetradecanoyltransferase 1-like isoform X2 [Corythoichthys intestinalis]XP_061807769.1 glycylpeptide N-tetradecanoyltransferase 1-like [Nerophis lumbriciformis]
MTDLNAGNEDGGGQKKSQKKQKKQDKWRAERPRDLFEKLDSLPESKQQEIQRALHLFSFGQSMPTTVQQAVRRNYKFWHTQPVPKLGEVVISHGQITECDESAREEPYSLPPGFSWDNLNLSSPAPLQELRAFLNENYTEDDDNTVMYDFSEDYLRWVLQPPNWRAQWHCGVRVDSNKKLVGFIAAVPGDVCVYHTEKRMAQIKFLCVHKKLRLKRMTPVLIRELARRVRRQGVAQAAYAAAVVLPTPISSCRLWHRPLNLRKLTELQYPGIRADMPFQRALKFYRLPEDTKTAGLRPMTRNDIEKTRELLQANLSKFQLKANWSSEEIEHCFLPREDVIDTYVVEVDGALTDVVSFYGISFKVLNHQLHSSLRAAHFFYVASDGSGDLVQLVEDVLVLVKSKGYDIFIAADVMDNKRFLEKLKFSFSGKRLYYYLYNWKCPRLSSDNVGLLLPN